VLGRRLMTTKGVFSRLMLFGICTLVICSSFATPTPANLDKTVKNMKNLDDTHQVPIFDPWLVFESHLDLDYDQEAVNNASFMPDGPPVSIPITIKYKVLVPDFLLCAPFALLKTIFLFGRIYRPFQEITLSIINAPEWAAISFLDPNPYVTIDNEYQEARTALIIAVHDDAPAESYALKLKAETPQLGRILEDDVYITIVFQTAYVPLISVYSPQPNVETPPNKITTAPFEIHNQGNAQTLVTGEIETELEGWTAYLNPSQVIIPIDEKAEMALVLKPPRHFNGRQQIQLLFTPYRSPPSGDPPGTPVLFVVTAYYFGT